VRSRQYTGRIVTVSNAKIFDEPVYNYTTEFPYIWDEIQIPLRYNSDHQLAEEIVFKAAQRHTLSFQDLGEKAVQELERRHFVKREQIRPTIYYRLTGQLARTDGALHYTRLRHPGAEGCNKS
jgi:small-conductance mechanosensitive channel